MPSAHTEASGFALRCGLWLSTRMGRRKNGEGFQFCNDQSCSAAEFTPTTFLHPLRNVSDEQSPERFHHKGRRAQGYFQAKEKKDAMGKAMS